MLRSCVNSTHVSVSAWSSGYNETKQAAHVFNWHVTGAGVVKG